MKFNLNDYVEVILTDAGVEIMRQEHADLKRLFSSLQDFVPPSTEEPTRFQLWRLMQIFGHHIGMAKALPFKPTLNIVEGQ